MRLNLTCAALNAGDSSTSCQFILSKFVALLDVNRKTWQNYKDNGVNAVHSLALGHKTLPSTVNLPCTTIPIDPMLVMPWSFSCSTNICHYTSYVTKIYRLVQVSTSLPIAYHLNIDPNSCLMTEHFASVDGKYGLCLVNLWNNVQMEGSLIDYQ